MAYVEDGHAHARGVGQVGLVGADAEAAHGHQLGRLVEHLLGQHGFRPANAKEKKRKRRGKIKKSKIKKINIIAQKNVELEEKRFRSMMRGTMNIVVAVRGAVPNTDGVHVAYLGAQLLMRQLGRALDLIALRLQERHRFRVHVLEKENLEGGAAVERGQRRVRALRAKQGGHVVCGGAEISVQDP